MTAANGTAHLPHNIEAEQSLLGAILLNNQAYGLVAGVVSAEDFYEPIHSRLYEECARQIVAGKVVTPVTLKDAFPELNIGGLSTSQYIARLAAEATTVINAPDFAAHVHDLAVVRGIMRVANDLAASRERLFAPDVAVREAFERLDALRSTARDGNARETIGRLAARLVDNAEHGDSGAAVVPSTGFSDLDRHLGGGYRPGRLIVLAGRPGMGKAQPLSAKVLTTSGWKLMRDIVVGDEIVRPKDGRAVKVTGVYPQGTKPIYNIRFHDGRTTQCCEDHIWKVWHRHWNRWRELPLRKIMGYSDPTRLSIPLLAAHYGGGRYLPLPPYMLGILLGDGYFHPNGVLFSTPDPEIVAVMRALCPAGHEVVHRWKYDYAITTRRWGNNEVLKAIRSLKLGKARSHTKFIPQIYLDASYDDRLNLLRGLLDSDGTVERDKTIRFSSTSEQLARQVVYLARSIGGWAKVRERARPRYGGKLGKRAWVVTIRHHVPASLFALERHRKRLGDGGQYAPNLRLSIAAIEPAGEAECQCIKVDSEDGLYFTDDFIVTHNTVLEAASARRVARRGYGVQIFSLEIDGAEMAARIIADELAMMPYGTPIAAYRDILTGALDEMQRHALTQAAERVQDLPIEIDATGGLSFFEIAARARITLERWRQRGIPPGAIFIDYLGLVTPSDRYRGRKVDELGEIAKAAKNLAKQLQVCVVLLAQLNRSVEGRDDKRPTMSDLRDSGSIEEHADVVGLLYRPYYYDERDPKVRAGDFTALEQMEKRKHDLDLGLGKNRLGPTATVRLWCDVSRSAVDNARLDY